MLDLSLDPVALTAALVDVPSESGSEAELASLVFDALAGFAHLSVERDGDAVVARTSFGHPSRVLLAGHLDTVPIAGNLPSRREGGRIHGCGTSDMKSSLAVMLRLAADVSVAAQRDLTFVFYDCEEVEAARNGLGRLERAHRSWLDADLALLMEPTDGLVEAGCQGTLRVSVTVPGQRAHTARAWMGVNAIHAVGEVLSRLAAYEPRVVEIVGCTFREGLQAVKIAGGVAGNVVPDEVTLTVNHRFAPDRSVEEALAHVASVLAPFELTVLDTAPGALPGLDSPVAKAFVEAIGSEPQAKLGWTDVSRFAALGLPALNYGPGDALLAHRVDESAEEARIIEAEAVLRRFLTG